jgi:hypothetical protein
MLLTLLRCLHASDGYMLHATVLRYYATCYMLHAYMPHVLHAASYMLHATCCHIATRYMLHATSHAMPLTPPHAIIALHANATCYMPHAAMLATCHAPHAATSLRHTPRHATPPRRYAATLLRRYATRWLHAAMPHAGYAATAKTRQPHAPRRGMPHATCCLRHCHTPRCWLRYHRRLHATCRPLAATTLMLLAATWPLTPHALIAYVTAHASRHIATSPHATC